MRKSHKRFVPLVALLATAVALLSSDPAMAARQKIVVPKSLVTTTINTYIRGYQFNLDTWGAWNGSDWYNSNSYILKPSGQRSVLDIPRSPTVTSAFRRYNGYINDLSSENVTVGLDGSRFKISIYFESAGDELKIGCVNRRKDEPCTTHLLKHTGQIDHAQVTAWLEPVLQGPAISFNDPEVRFDFDLHPDSWVLSEMKEVVDWFVDTDGIIKRVIPREFKKQLKDSGTIAGMERDLNGLIVDRVANRLGKVLGRRAHRFVLDNLKITKLEERPESYVIHVKYPDPVTSNSLQIKAFEVVAQSAAIECPGDITFKATIHTDYEMSGKVWLENENGKTTNKLDWTNGEDKTTTSTITRRWNRKDFDVHRGWSRLVISFTDVFGQPQIKKSARETFRRTCTRPEPGIKSR